MGQIAAQVSARQGTSQARLEHADISMTPNRYIHVTPDMQRSAADTLDAVFTKVS
jgi:integrase